MIEFLLKAMISIYSRTTINKFMAHRLANPMRKLIEIHFEMENSITDLQNFVLLLNVY